MNALPCPNSPPKRQTPAQRLGRAAEDAALHHLTLRGLALLARNVRFRVGELDLVMQDRETIVFVEVRYRSPSRFGLARDSITSPKQQRIIRAAQCWLQRGPQGCYRSLRFDVVTLDGAQLRWTPHAFTADGAL